MTWRYQQSTGKLSKNGVAVGTGYSGLGAGLNNPADQAIEGEGPIPQGLYGIGTPLDPPDHLGPLAMPLTPLPGTDTFGRSAFFIHGDNAGADHTASHGCVIMDRPIRADIATTGDDRLEVIA